MVCTFSAFTFPIRCIHDRTVCAALQWGKRTRLAWNQISKHRIQECDLILAGTSGTSCSKNIINARHASNTSIIAVVQHVVQPPWTQLSTLNNQLVPIISAGKTIIIRCGSSGRGGGRGGSWIVAIFPISTYIPPSIQDVVVRDIQSMGCFVTLFADHEKLIVYTIDGV
jgi:hypothetical protein